MNEHYVINLGRQLGSGGKEIGEKLAQAFGIAFYDKELIKLASEESGLCKEFFEKADEKASQSIIGGLFGTRFPFISDGAIPYGSCLSNDALFKIQSDVIRELADRQSCLFVHPQGTSPTYQRAFSRSYGTILPSSFTRVL